MNELEKRLIDLEVKYTFQEDLIAQLNEIVTTQQFTLDKLAKEIKQLHSSIEGLEAPSNNGLADEKPPHY